MGKMIFILLTAIFLIMKFCENVSAAEEDISNKVLMERIDNSIEIQKLMLDQMNRRFEDVNKKFEDVNKRFEDVNKKFEDINRRFEDMNKRFEDINRRFEDMNGRFGDMNKRFGDMNKRFGDMNKRFEDVNRRLDSMYNLILVLIGIISSGFIGVIGVILWDRRTFLTKEQERIRKVEERQKIVEEVVIELAKEDEGLVSKIKALSLQSGSSKIVGIIILLVTDIIFLLLGLWLNLSWTAILALIGATIVSFGIGIELSILSRPTYSIEEQKRLRRLEERAKIIEEVMIELAKGDEGLVKKLKASGSL